MSEMSLNVSNNEVYVSLEPLAIKLPPFNVRYILSFSICLSLCLNWPPVQYADIASPQPVSDNGVYISQPWIARRQRIT